MSKQLISIPLSLAIALAILLVPAGEAAAQSQIPIDDDDIMACVTVGEIAWAAPVALKTALEAATGRVATVQTMAEMRAGLPPASPSNGVRIEGGYATGDALDGLRALGYVTATPQTPEVVGAGMALLYTE